MSRFKWHVILGSILIGISIIFYLIQYAIFQDAQSIFNNLFTQLGFLPVSVFLVTIVISQLLTVREKRAKMNKLNMVIGAFFSEVGTKILKIFSVYDPHAGSIRKDLIMTPEWPDQKFLDVNELMKNYHYTVAIERIDLQALREFLLTKRNFLLMLLENPNLLEHESFTELLWAVFHLSEELVSRKDMSNLPDTDYEHLSGDIKRVYSLLFVQWLAYMKHLRDDYPYLFSLAIRTNPFDPNASPEVK